MSEISTDIIENAVYNLCFNANTCLDKRVYSKILEAYEKNQDIKMKDILKSILQNAKTAYDKKRPLCQDTGQVIVFIEIGWDVKLTGEFLEKSVNNAVKKCYIDNYFRKSTVKNAVFDRQNTKTNTPAVIYTKYINGNSVKIKVIIKGAGSENKSGLKMLLPTAKEKDIIKNCGRMILLSGENACPPLFAGIAIGSTIENACLMSKKALICDTFSNKEEELAQKIKNYVNAKSPNKYHGCYLLDVKLISLPAHIACMPLAITLNCHSERISSCTIKENEIFYEHKIPDFIEFNSGTSELKEIKSDDIESLKKLKEGEEFLLTGKIYTARDMAHKRIYEMLKKGEKIPFDIKNGIIFYAGPCPAKEGEIIGSIGPTTASRMDKYAADLYNKGMLASIGKGERSDKIKKTIKQNSAKYFTVTGGIAALLADKVKSSEIIAFPEYGTEAVYMLYVEKFPLKTEIA